MNATDRELRMHTACLMVLAAIAICLTLFWLRSVLIPFVLALFFTAGLAPILDLIEQRLRAPRLVAVGIAFLVGLVLMFALWSFVWLSVQSLLQDRAMYIERFDELIRQANRYLPPNMQLPGQEDAPPTDAAPTDAAPAETVPVDAVETPGGGDVGGTAAAQPAPPSSPAFDNASLRSYASYAVSLISTALLDLSSNAVVVLIFMFFLLLGGSTAAIPRGGVWREIEGKIRSYIVTKTVISALTGLAFGIVLWVFGVPLALVFGLLAFLLNFIPNIGPVIASLLPLPLILLHPELSLFQMVLVIVLSSAVQVVSGNVIETKVMGDSFELHPIAILLTLMFWGVLWGIVGMFLAVPMTAAVNILLARFERTRPIADILAGRFETLTEMLGDQEGAAAADAET